MTPRVLLLAALAACVGAWAAARACAEDPPATGAPATVARLVEELCGADPARATAAEEALRLRALKGVPALRKAAAGLGKQEARRIVRLLGRIETDWQRANTPEGMIYVPAGYVEVPRTQAPWGPSGTRELVAAFYIDRTEVTIGQWSAWLATFGSGAQGESAGHSLPAPPEDADRRLPMGGVMWTEACQFAREYRRGRLPEAQEFDRALRGAGISTWPWGPEFVSGHANLAGHGPGKPWPVGSCSEGAGACGALDLVGNLAEWSATEIAQGSSGRFPLVLGGSYQDEPDETLAWRGWDRMRARVGGRERAAWIGFRVVKDVARLP